MPKLHNFEDKSINEEFQNVYSTLDRYIVGATVPPKPVTGTLWFNPDTGKLKVWKTKSWEAIN